MERKQFYNCVILKIRQSFFNIVVLDYLEIGKDHDIWPSRSLSTSRVRPYQGCSARIFARKPVVFRSTRWSSPLKRSCVSGKVVKIICLSNLNNLDKHIDPPRRVERILIIYKMIYLFEPSKLRHNKMKITIRPFSSTCNRSCSKRIFISMVLKCKNGSLQKKSQITLKCS